MRYIEWFRLAFFFTNSWVETGRPRRFVFSSTAWKKNQLLLRNFMKYSKKIGPLYLQSIFKLGLAFYKLLGRLTEPESPKKFIVVIPQSQIAALKLYPANEARNLPMTWLCQHETEQWLPLSHRNVSFLPAADNGVPQEAPGILVLQYRFAEGSKFSTVQVSKAPKRQNRARFYNKNPCQWRTLNFA